ncbi:MAG: chemotaxis protein CheA [bacterium]|nr:chemotaxis protein CheA [bacterium]MDT8364861.1 chemotaxis protein CheA [bacterium]
MDQSLKDFVAEAEDILDNLDESISLLMDIDPDDHRKPDIINAVFRHAHSIKGLSGMFNLEGVSSLSHKMENLLDSLRLDKIPLSDHVVELLGQGFQNLVRMVRAISEGRGDISVELGDYLKELEQLEKGEENTQDNDLSTFIGIPSGITDILSEYEEHRFRDNIKRGMPFFRVSCSFPLDTFDVQLEALGSAIREMGELLTTLPQTNLGGDGNIGFTLYFTSREPEGEVMKTVGSDERTLESVPYLGGTPSGPGNQVIDTDTPARFEEGSFEDEIRGVSQTVRVDIGKLDYLMNLVGELVIMKSGFVNIAQRLRNLGDAIPSDLMMDFGKSTTNMEKKLVDLRDGVMDIRMVPMGQLYNRLQRVSKKIAKDLGKKVNLQFVGHETELDKMIMEEMVSPLLHIVRNSLDHGIEDVEVRRSKGKPDTGNIKVSAYQQGNHVILEVEDDGKGIDLVRIKKEAVRRGDVKKDEIYTEDEVLGFLFKPGFSTKEGVTEISGRGVGMDVVRKELEKVGGAVEIRTTVDKGTRVILTLPITLAILQALLIRNGDRIFAVPMGSVQETIELTREVIKTMQGQEVITLRDRTLPLIRLEKVFSLPPVTEGKSIYVVIVAMANRSMGLVTGDLIGKQDVVIKPLGDSFSKSVGLAGAAELGDQSTILVLDVAGLMTEAIRLGAMGKRAH